MHPPHQPKRDESGRKIALNFGEDIRIFAVLCLKSPPTKIFWIRHCRRILLVDKLRYFGCVHCANSVRIALLQVHCNLIAALMLQLTTLIDLTCCFFFCFEADNFPSRKFCFLTSRKLVFGISSPFCLILFILLVFNLIEIIFGVKACYFYYGKCSS